jgi:Ser/Thr protein kinase RdoA (MazF antagonist)
MDTFPAQYSTLSAIALKDYIENVYGFQNLTCKLLVRNVSDTYVLEHSETKYILKVYRAGYRTLNEIKGEVELLNILKNNGISVSYPIPDLSGNHIQYFQAAEGIRYGILYTFAKGKVMQIPNNEQLQIIGRDIALMHNVTSACKLQHERITYDIDTTLEIPLATIKTRFADLPDEYAFLRDIADKTIEKLNGFGLSTFSHGYCHYDLLPKNFHFDENNNITFFDFDWTGKGFLVNDLMTFFVQLFFLAQANVITREQADNDFAKVIESYRQHRPLSTQEVEAIPYLGIMFWIHAFGFYETNYDDFAIAFLTQRFIKERVELIKKWSEWYCEF